MKTKYYKHILLAALCFSQINGMVAQEESQCATDKMREAMFRAHPEMIQEAMEYEKALQAQIQNARNSRAVDDTSIYYIPVVFHVIHVNGSENISDAQIFDEMVNLNNYFRHLNPYINTIVPGFDSIAGDVRIQFRLATIDPNGHCTNGIDRIYSHLTLNANDNAKLNPWPRDKYLNVWTIKTFASSIGSGVLAYATFPNSSVYAVATDGVIIKANAIGDGSPGTNSIQYSSTLTHEVGHYLNLYHTWGPGNAVETVCGDDGVDDTPVTKGRQNKCSATELYTPYCVINTITNGYTFSDVTPISGAIDSTATPFPLASGADFGSFSAVGVSANSSDSSRFSFTNWDTGAIDGDTAFANLTGSINTSKYYEVTIKPNIRYAATLTGITFEFERDSTGVRSYSVRSSVDGFTNNLTASSTNPLISVKTGNQFFSQYDTTESINGFSITLSGASFKNFTTPITFRFYGWNAEDAAGTFSIDNVSFIGTVGALENVQNYMDYSWCIPSQNMFTLGQKERMRAALTNVTGQRNKLYINSNLDATGTNGVVSQTCPPYPQFYANRYTICAGGTVTFTKNILNGTPVGLPVWTFSGGTPSTSTATNPVVTYNTPGFYDVKLVATNSAGTDSVIKEGKIRVYENYGYHYGPYKETFESSNPFGWEMENLDYNAPNEWAYTSEAGYNSSKSVVMKGYNNYFGDVDELFTPSYDLSNVTNAALTFRCAAASKAQVATDMNDVLNIYSSNNCGQTWQSRASLTGTTLNNNGFYSGSFVPTSASQWALQTVNIPAGIATSNVRFKFEYISGNKSNNIYIDDVNVDGIVGIKENALSNSNIAIYPNPTNQTSTISYHLNQRSNVKIEIVDIIGKIISETNDTQLEGDHSFIISKQQLNLNNGIYFVKFSVDNNTITQKLIITE